MKNYRARVLVALACALMAASVSWAVIAISAAADLAFGSFVAGSGGSVTVTPGGVRSASGGVVLVPSGAGAAAQFSVTGTAGATYAITLPTGATLASGANTMAVGTFTSDPSPTGTLTGGSQTLRVGATLTVGSTQATGIYSGTFDVTVIYN